jgi:1,3-beta-glucanosyltransferase GAS3
MLTFDRYQPGGSAGFDPGSGRDPLSNGEVCLRDATLMQRLGMNTIRVYNLDPDLDHTECASIFNAAGIYMILDVNSPLPNESLNRGAPWESYSDVYLERVFKVVEAFMNFPNTLGFFSGNEVINEDSVEEVPAYIRAVTRDIKDYIASRSPRPIPVGYSAADVRPLLMGTYNYFACAIDEDDSSKIDFFGLNSYSWCGDATYESSEYDVLVENFGNTTIPIFFSEYGCNLVSPRTWTEVPTIYGEEMSRVFSGGVIYEYTQEENNYGLVQMPDTTGEGDVEILQDYDNLLQQMNTLDINILTSPNNTATSLTPPSCDSGLVSGVNFTTEFELPERPSGVDDMINNGVGGDFPQGTTEVTNTQVTQGVTGADGSDITGLELTILPEDAYNLPGNNTSGTGAPRPDSGDDDDSDSSSGEEDAAPRLGGLQLGTLIMGALTVAFFTQL